MHYFITFYYFHFPLKYIGKRVNRPALTYLVKHVNYAKRKYSQTHTKSVTGQEKARNRLVLTQKIVSVYHAFWVNWRISEFLVGLHPMGNYHNKVITYFL